MGSTKKKFAQKNVYTVDYFDYIYAQLTAINLAPSGLKEAPPSSLKCIGVGIVNCFVTERSAILRNTTYKMVTDVSVKYDVRTCEVVK